MPRLNHINKGFLRQGLIDKRGNIERRQTIGSASAIAVVIGKAKFTVHLELTAGTWAIFVNGAAHFTPNSPH